MILSILKLLFKLAPAILEAVRKWDAELNAQLVVEAQERAIALERLKRRDASLQERQERLHAETEALKKELADLLVNYPIDGGK
jgi:folate-dependent phosphoribosylglycinamide formyltransferase PurN